MAEEELTREAIDAYHSKGTPVWSGDLVNKGSFLTEVKLVAFFDGSELPFEIEGNLNIKIRMPFVKARTILPRPMFDPAFPMVSKVAPLRYKNLAYVYTEVRAVNDVNNNAIKTAEFLLTHEWVAVVQTSKESKMYIFPTCSLSHELGITHRNHPQMLHGLFVKFLVNKGTQTVQGLTVEQLYKAGLAKPDTKITRDKVTLYQIKAEKPKNHLPLSNGIDSSEVEPIAEDSKSEPNNETSKLFDAVKSDIIATVTSDVITSATSDVIATVTSDVITSVTSDVDHETTVVSDIVLPPTATSTAIQPTTTATVTTTTSPCTTTITTMTDTTTTAAAAAATTTTIAATATTLLLPTTISSTVTCNAMSMPAVTTTTTTTESAISSATDSQPSSITSKEDNISNEVENNEPKVGQKRPATSEVSGGSTPKRKTRESLRNSLQQLLEGKSSISEDDTARTPTSITAADVQFDNITVSDEVFQSLESAMSMISTRELHSIIKPLQTNVNKSPTKSKPVVTTSSDVVAKVENDILNSMTATAISPTLAAGDKTSPVPTTSQAQFYVPTVVYDKPCKRPKSILKGGNKMELDDTSVVVSEDSPTASTSAKVPKKIGLAEYKKRHRERKDSEDTMEDVSFDSSTVETPTKSTSKDGKTSVGASSPTKGLMIVEDVEPPLDGTATSKANTDVSVSFKEEKKGDSPAKSEPHLAVVSASQTIGKPIKIPHPMSVLAPASSAIIPHKYTSNLPDLSMAQFFSGGSQYPSPAYRHDWPTTYPIFGGLSRPYLMPHPPTAPLPSTILTTPLLPSVPPVVYDPLPPVPSTHKADEEMARVEDLTEMFTKNLQSKLKRVIHSDDSSRESSPRRSRSLSRSQSPPLRSSRRGRSPRRSRRSNSRSKSLDSCQGSDHEQTRSRSKSPRSHKAHRSHRHRSLSRDSNVEDRRHSRSLKRSRNEKRRDHKPTTNSKTTGTQTEENTYKSGDTKRLVEKDVQTDRLLFVHSKGSQTCPMFENHKAVQADLSVCSNFYADFAQYLETYPIDVFHFNEILNSSITYFEQEISKAFPCNKTLTSKQLRRILQFDHMKKLSSQLDTLLQEGQCINPYMVGTDRPGTPLLDDNQAVVNLVPPVPEGDEGNEQPDDDESSGLSNSEILMSDSEGSNDNTPSYTELLSQYSKPTQERTPSEISHATSANNSPKEPVPTQVDDEKLPYKYTTKPDDNAHSTKGAHEDKETVLMDDASQNIISEIIVKEEDTEVDKSFVPENYQSVDLHRVSPPLPNTNFFTSLQNDHTYTKAGGYPSGTQLKVPLDPLAPKINRTLLTVVNTKIKKGCDTGKKKASTETALGEEIYQSIRKGCEEYLSSTVHIPAGDNNHHSGGESNPNEDKVYSNTLELNSSPRLPQVSTESDHDNIDMEISLTDSQNEEDAHSSIGAEEKERVTDETKSQSQPSKSSQSNTEDKTKRVGSPNDSKTKTSVSVRKTTGSTTTKDLHHYTHHASAVPLHYQAQPYKYRPQRPQLLYYGAAPRPDLYNPPWDWRRNYSNWGPPRY